MGVLTESVITCQEHHKLALSWPQTHVHLEIMSRNAVLWGMRYGDSRKDEQPRPAQVMGA
jgi:hypothetical protein